MRLFFHSSLALLLAACGTSPSNTAATSAGSAGGQQPQANQAPPFRLVEVTRFEEAWAMDFLPGSGLPLTNAALVTGKGGELWLVDVATGRKQQVSGVPTVRYAGQGGLGDVVAHPDFAGNQRVYLSFAEAGPGSPFRRSRRRGSRPPPHSSTPFGRCHPVLGTPSASSKSTRVSSTNT